MSKTRDTGYLANVIQVHDTGVRIMSGSTMLMAISSSGAVTTTGVISGSDAANSLLLNGTGSVGFTTTGSFSTASGSASSRLTQIEAVYATTGSNSFRATQSITGSLTVTGQIIAQTINVQQVTSSIIYSSGSNVFGCDINSRQTFTGSFYQTGSVANFSTTVNIGCVANSAGYSFQVFGNDNRIVTQDNNNGTSGVFMRVLSGGTQVGNSTLRVDNTGKFSLFTGTSSEGERLSITSVGNLGIGCTTPSYILDVRDGTTGSAGGRGMRLSVCSNSAGPQFRLEYQCTGDARNWLIGTNQEVAGDFIIRSSTVAGCDPGGVCSTTRMLISKEGNTGIGNSSPRTRLQVTPSYNAEVPVLGCASGIVSFTSTNTNYGLQFNSTSDGTFHIQSQRFDGSSTAYDIVLNYAGGKVGIGKTPSAFLDITGGSDGDQMISIGSNSVSGVLSTPSNLYINADSDNNSGTGQITLGFNRTGYTGGMAVLNILETCQIGLMVAPSAWASPFNVIQGGYYGQHVGFQTNGADMKIGSNNYYYGAGYKYTCSGYGATQVNVGASTAGGYFSINAAACGTSGTDITFTERFSVGADGSVNIDCAGVGTRSYITMGRFSNSTTNTGAAYIGRASDRPVGQMTVQLGGSDTRTFEVVDYAWSRVAFFVNGSGNYDFAGSDISDRRQKCNIHYIEDNQICTIMKLKSASFNKKNGVGGINDNVHTGFIAQDVLEANIPNLVHGKEEDGYGLDYNGILSLAVKAIQEQQCTINLLKTCIGIS